jgi:1-acyl-sn-glycerol-3-phosphate acyltransferase
MFDDRNGNLTAERLAKHPLWHVVGMGATPYARLAFKIETIGADGFRFLPGTLITVTHRAETDAPILIAELYRSARLWAEPRQRLHFAARDDMFERGFFAGLPAGLPPAARRLLYPIAIGRYLRMVRVHPVGSAHRMRLGQALERVEPAAPLPDAIARPLERRAAEVGLAPPRTAGEALRGEYADLLWRSVEAEDFPAPEAWSRRQAEARTQVETLLDLLREREPLLLFPEGRPSPDGTVGPLQRGLSLLVRRGRPERISPWAIGYDPLVRGRPRAVVSVRPAFAPEARGVDDRVLAELKLAMPLTCGSLVAHALQGGATTDKLAAALDAAVEEARAEGRNLEHELASPETRRRRLAECLSALKRRGVSPGDPVLVRLAREYESARQATG